MVVSVGIAWELTPQGSDLASRLYQRRNEGSGWREGQAAMEEV